MLNLFYQSLEIFATFVEGFIVFYITCSATGRKYPPGKHYSLVLLFTAIYTALITYLNSFDLFSFYTIVFAAVYCFIASSLICSGGILLRLTASSMAWFFIHALDAVLTYGMIMIIGGSFDLSQGLSYITEYGPSRAAYLAVNKFLQLLVFFSAHKLYPKIKLLNKKYMLWLFIITTTAFVVMEILISLTFSDSILVLQTAIILSLFFIVLAIVTTIFAVTVSSRYQNEKNELELMAVANTVMEKNFAEMKLSQNIIKQQVHDFKNHIRIIDGMLEKSSPAKEYVKELLSVSYAQAKLCQSGNDIIDSIINCKITEARAVGIPFEHRVALSSELSVSSTDICAILANQIDNALEACEKIKDPEKRFAKVEIWQKDSFIFFKVTNSVENNPFENNSELKSTKKNAGGIHGFGIKNIRETSAKYDGLLENNFKNGIFISTVMLINNAN